MIRLIEEYSALTSIPLSRRPLDPSWSPLPDGSRALAGSTSDGSRSVVVYGYPMQVSENSYEDNIRVDCNITTSDQHIKNLYKIYRDQKEAIDFVNIIILDPPARTNDQLVNVLMSRYGYEED